MWLREATFYLLANLLNFYFGNPFVRCIPFRYRNSDEIGDADPKKIVEVLMINSPSGPGLLFPKVHSFTFYWSLKR